ncbi:MAG: DUF1840 family protein [Steroidobacteraceae bacterium]
MIVKFSTRHDEVYMHGEAALALIAGMGHTATVPGAILAPDLPAALATLERTLETEGSRVPVPPSVTDGDAARAEHEAPVTLATRAVPLVATIRVAIARDSNLMWDRA